MKTFVSLLSAVNRKIVLILLCTILFGFSCTKEYSAEGPIPAGPVSIFTSQVPDGQTENDSTGGIELGLRFRSTIPGYVEGIRFYKTCGNTGIHTAQLYTFDGLPLGTAVFVNETDSGWQTMLFSSAIPIAANTTYIAAYYSSLGNYTSTNYGLNTAVTNGPLTALADGADGINGLYKYTNTPAFPGLGHLSNNYWVDPIVSIHPVD
jgi:uncharacterized protein DUF4082